MNNIFKFRKRARQQSPWIQRKADRGLSRITLKPVTAVLLVSSLFLGNFFLWKEPALYLWNKTAGEISSFSDAITDKSSETTATSSETTSQSFGMCGRGNWHNCVVDGDTFYLQGQSIRIADIDTPETHPARCAYEADLGEKATRRLYELLNESPFTMEPLADRDEDKYGRKLRIITRGGQSLGGILVAEGLAREWTGHRMPWCS